MENENFIRYIFPVLIVGCFCISFCGIIHFRDYFTDHLRKKNNLNIMSKQNEKNKTLLKESDLTKSLMV
jgi:hypothetical protein